MSKNYIISSKLIGLIFALSLIFFKVEDSYSSIIFVIVMLTIGIPHGSVDHIIAFINPKSRRFKSKLSFFTVYLSLIVLNIIIWVFSPYLGLFTFLLVSCYHFGEAQVIGFNNTKNKLLNFVLGANILLSLFLNNIFELQIILLDLTLFSSIDLSSYDKTFFLLISVAVLMISVVYFKIEKKVPLYAEMSILYLIFYHTDILTSFSIYFGFSHSLPMLLLEYKEMKEKNFLSFYAKTLPFTILAIIFGIVLYYYNNDLLTANNLILFTFIVISSLTLPHVFIMKDFVENK
ncbi:MAG: Brp/Blh family beta-carotene 15,15'-dioxygenase [Cytophagales bacterium]